MRDLYVRTFTSCFTIKSETTAAVQKKKSEREREGSRAVDYLFYFSICFLESQTNSEKIIQQHSKALVSFARSFHQGAVQPQKRCDTQSRKIDAVQLYHRLFWSRPIRCRGGWAAVEDALGDEGGMCGQLVVGQWSFSQESRVGHRWVHNDLRILHFGARAVFVCAGQTSVRRGKVFTFEEAAGGIGWWWGATYSREEGAAEAQRRTEWTDMYSFARSRVNPAERHQHCKWLHTHSDRITRELIPHMMELLVTFPNIFLTDAHKERCESCILNCF